MLYQWYYANAHGKSAPCSARQLKECADAGQIQPLDYVSFAGADRCVRGASAYQIKGVLPSAYRIIAVAFPSSYGNCSATVTVNGHALGTITFGIPFCDAACVQPGRHVVEVKIALRFKKTYLIDIRDVGVYHVEPLFDNAWKNFQNNCNIYLNPTYFSFIDEQWDADRQFGQCPSCGAEWVALYRRNKVINKQYMPRTITRTQQHEMQNPNFDPFNPGYAPRHLYGESQGDAQVTMTVDAIRYWFQCEQCSHKWTRDSTNEYVE